MPRAGSSSLSSPGRRGGSRRRRPRTCRRAASPRRRRAASKTLRDAGQVDLAALAAPGDDDEGEVDDDVGVLDQRVDRLAVEDVAAPVFGLLPALRAGSKGRRAMPITRSTSGHSPARR